MYRDHPDNPSPSVPGLAQRSLTRDQISASIKRNESFFVGLIGAAQQSQLLQSAVYELGRITTGEQDSLSPSLMRAAREAPPFDASLFRVSPDLSISAQSLSTPELLTQASITTNQFPGSLPLLTENLFVERNGFKRLILEVQERLITDPAQSHDMAKDLLFDLYGQIRSTLRSATKGFRHWLENRNDLPGLVPLQPVFDEVKPYLEHTDLGAPKLTRTGGMGLPKLICALVIRQHLLPMIQTVSVMAGPVGYDLKAFESPVPGILSKRNWLSLLDYECPIDQVHRDINVSVADKRLAGEICKQLSKVVDQAERFTMRFPKSATREDIFAHFGVIIENSFPPNELDQTAVCRKLTSLRAVAYYPSLIGYCASRLERSPPQPTLANFLALELNRFAYDRGLDPTLFKVAAMQLLRHVVHRILPEQLDAQAVATKSRDPESKVAPSAALSTAEIAHLAVLIDTALPGTGYYLASSLVNFKEATDSPALTEFLVNLGATEKQIPTAVRNHLRGADPSACCYCEVKRGVPMMSEVTVISVLRNAREVLPHFDKETRAHVLGLVAAFLEPEILNSVLMLEPETLKAVAEVIKSRVSQHPRPEHAVRVAGYWRQAYTSGFFIRVLECRSEAGQVLHEFETCTAARESAHVRALLPSTPRERDESILRLSRIVATADHALGVSASLDSMAAESKAAWQEIVKEIALNFNDSLPNFGGFIKSLVRVPNILPSLSQSGLVRKLLDLSGGETPAQFDRIVDELSLLAKKGPSLRVFLTIQALCADSYDRLRPTSLQETLESCSKFFDKYGVIGAPLLHELCYVTCFPQTPDVVDRISPELRALLDDLLGEDFRPRLAIASKADETNNRVALEWRAACEQLEEYVTSTKDYLLRDADCFTPYHRIDYEIAGLVCRSYRLADRKPRDVAEKVGRAFSSTVLSQTVESFGSLRMPFSRTFMIPSLDRRAFDDFKLEMNESQLLAVRQAELRLIAQADHETVLRMLTQTLAVQGFPSLSRIAAHGVEGLGAGKKPDTILKSTLEELLSDFLEADHRNRSDAAEAVLRTLSTAYVCQSSRLNASAAQIGEENEPVEALTSYLEYQSAVLENEALTSLMSESSPDAQQRLARAWEASPLEAALMRVYERSNMRAKSKSLEVRFYLTKGLLSNLIGDICDTCFQGSLDKHPNAAFIAFLPVQQKLGVGPTGVLGGSVLIQTKLTTGERALLVRGYNPVIGLLKKAPVEALWEAYLSYVREIGARINASVIIAPQDVISCRAFSNRSLCHLHFAKQYRHAVPVRVVDQDEIVINQMNPNDRLVRIE